MKKNKLICLAVALATMLMVVTGCASSQPASEATGNSTTEQAFDVYSSYILGEFIEADEGTVLLAQEEIKVKVSGKNVSTQKFVIKDRFSEQFYSCPISAKTRGIAMQGDDVVVDIVFFVKDDICVPTPYGELHFSDEWADYLDVTAEDGKSYTFFYDIDGARAPLFTVYFDGNGKTTAGHLNGGETLVSITIEDVGSTDNDAVMAMAEGVNYLVDNFSQLDGFETAF